MERRVYRGNCPYEELFEIEFDGDCKNCEEYRKCIRRERRRKRRKKRCIMMAIILSIIAVFVISVIALIVSFISWASNGSNKPANSNYEPETVISEPNESSKVSIEIDVSVSNSTSSEMPENTTSSNIMIENNVEIYSSSSSQPIFIEVLPVISAYGPGEVYYYELSYEDKVYMAMVVYAESRGEKFEGKVAVAATVLNRFVSEDARFDRESIYSIITQSGQYASIADVTMEDLENNPKCMEAVEAACKGWDPTRVVFEEGAKFFFNPDGDLSDSARQAREGIETYRIGNHLFHNDLNY